jgi:hypothetical protein
MAGNSVFASITDEEEPITPGADTGSLPFNRRRFDP